MHNSGKVLVAVIGCGYWGKNLVRKFHDLGVLAAVSDPSPEVQKRMQDEYGVAARGYDDILADDSIGAVVIAAPAEMHCDMALKAFSAGKHVYVEKPIALSIRDAEKMCVAADRSGKTLMVGHLLQYHPVFLKLKDMVRDGELGKLRYIYSNRLNTGLLRTEENVLWSFAPHDFSMILALAGEEPDKVDGFGSSFLDSRLSDFASVHMSFPNNIRAHVNVSWLHPTKEQRLIVVGDKAMAVFDDRADWPEKLVVYRHKAEIRDGAAFLEKDIEGSAVAVEAFEPLLNECKHFIRFVETGETPYTDGYEALRVLKVLRAGDVV